MTVGALLPIASLEFAEKAWPRAGADEERLALFAELYASGGVEALPPIEVIRRPICTSLIADGPRRAFAALSVGLKQIPAQILPLANGADAFAAAYRRGLE